ncbi:OsmC family protein [Kitasatospora sp. DSM 101779]|uniref:OsmC family protein n=1 Tax=Kitasatospora sp. DSM 101779 TaxID=2853165 RepID=UPI0021DA52CA|nr:OsmC family protein [Kitasatospora sp. DSM 101779]MCU7826479.1 OsmC family protein [Kitasatospora sp. DSM 101779]
MANPTRPITTAAGGSLLVTRAEAAEHGPVVLDLGGTGRAALTCAEARQVAAALIRESAAAGDPDGAGRTKAVHLCDDRYAISVRGHVLTVDQPVADGGADTAPTPLELFTASLAACVAHYAGRYLSRHGIDRDGLRVTVDHRMAADRPARIASADVRVIAPRLPQERTAGLLAVASHRTVHNTLTHSPEVTIAVKEAVPCASRTS